MWKDTIHSFELYLYGARSSCIKKMIYLQLMQNIETKGQSLTMKTTTRIWSTMASGSNILQNVEIFIFTLNDNKNGHQEFFLKTHILTLCLKFLKNTSKWIAFCDKFSGCRPIETKSNKLLHRYCLSILTTDTVKLRYRSFFHRTPIFVEELSMDASADLQSHTM